MHRNPALPLLLTLMAASLSAGAGLAQTLPAVWDRDVDWVAPPDTADGTTQGNPAPDSEGNLVYHYEFTTTGGGLGSANPWYEEPMTALVWDKAWYGGDGAWAVSDNFGTVIKSRGATQAGQWFEYRPMIRWVNVTGMTFDLAIAGSISVGWNGDFGSATPIDVDVVLAHRDAATGALTILYSGTVPKPNNDDSVESLFLPIDLPPMTIDAGDELLLSHHAFETFVNGKWVSIGDFHLCMVQSPVGTSYCGPAVENSAGLPARIAAAGSTQVTDNDLTLKAWQMPYDQFGFFLASPKAGFVANPGGSAGNLCLGGGIGRFNKAGQIFDTGVYGAGSLDVDLDAMPTPQGTVQVQPGETWHFQCWYRDGATSNFTDGIAVTFD